MGAPPFVGGAAKRAKQSVADGSFARHHPPLRTQETSEAPSARLSRAAADTYRTVRRIGDSRGLWSAPAERSGDGALAGQDPRAERAKAGSHLACPRTAPKRLAPQ